MDMKNASRCLRWTSTVMAINYGNGSVEIAKDDQELAGADAAGWWFQGPGF